MFNIVLNSQTLNTHPFVVENPQKNWPKCTNCYFEDGTIFCNHFNHIFCCNCFYKQHIHKEKKQSFFDLLNNNFTSVFIMNSKYQVSKNKKKCLAINFICLCNYDKELYEILLPRGDLNATDPENTTFFQMVCKQEIKMETIKYCISKGENIGHIDNLKRTCFHYVCEKNNDYDLIKYFLQQGMDLNHKDVYELTPFYLICNYRPTLKLIKLCLKYKANFTDTFNQKLNILHLIVKQRNTDDIIQFLLKKNYDFYQNNIKRDATPFHFLCSKGHLTKETLLAFIEKGVNLNQKHEEDENNTPFHYYCKNINIDLEIVELFLKNGANPNQQTKKALYTPLMYYLTSIKKHQKKNYVNYNELISYSETEYSNESEIGNENENESENENNNKNKRKKKKEIKMKKKQEEDERINNFNYQMVSKFLKYGAKLNIKNCSKKNICHEIITYIKPNLEIIKLLLKWKANFNKPSGYGKETPFSVLCKIKNLDREIIQECLNNGSNPNKKDYEKNTPFQFFCFENKNINIEIMKLFFKKGAKLNTKNLSKESAFTYLCQNKNVPIEVIKYCLTKKKPNIKFFGYVKQNILHVLCKNAKIDQEMLKFFIQNKVKIKELDQDGKTAFHYLLKTNCKLDIETIKLFLDNGFDINDRANSKKESPFILLCQNRHPYELYKSIFDLNIIKDINTADHDGNTPFHYICGYHKDIRILELFLQNGSKINLANKNSMLPFFIHFNNSPSIETFQLLLDHGMDINHVNSYNETPFRLYCRHRALKFDILYYFFKNGLNYKNVKHQAETPLHLICSTDYNLNLKILQLFFDNGFNINDQDEQGNTPFHLYCKKKKINTKIIECFLKNNPDKNLKNENGQTVLDLLLYHSEVDTNLVTKMFRVNFNSLKTDFKTFYTRNEFTDFEIKEIKVHKALLEIRTKQKIEKIKEIIEKYPKKSIKHFLKWIYFGKIPTKTIGNQIEEEEKEGKEKDNINKKENFRKFKNFTDICSQLKINYKSKEFSFNQSIRNLYENEKLKDFIIILKEKQHIEVNKLILQCRSGLYRGMFLNVVNSDNLNQINDYSGLSVETFNKLLYFLYTGSLDKKINITEEIKYELIEAVDYFQLDPNCTLKYLLLD